MGYLPQNIYTQISLPDFVENINEKTVEKEEKYDKLK